jgi:short-subunit dehydrogenase
MRPAAVVTGAGSGIGREIALALAKKGTSVFGVALGEGELARLAADAAALGGEVQTMAIDLTRAGAPLEVLEEAERRGLVVETLVNCAGVGVYGEHLDTEVDAVSKMITLNAAVLTELTTLAARRMRTRGRGNILNVASTAAFQPLPRLAAYAATKHYVAAFTLALREELAGTGVVVSLLCPGITNTPFIEGTGVKGGSRTDAVARRIAMTPESVARAAVSALETGERMAIAGAVNRAHYALSRALPASALSVAFERVTKMVS